MGEYVVYGLVRLARIKTITNIKECLVTKMEEAKCKVCGARLAISKII